MVDKKVSFPTSDRCYSSSSEPSVQAAFSFELVSKDIETCPQNIRKGFLLAALTSAVLNVQAAEQEYNLLEVYNLALRNDAQLAAAQFAMKASQEVVPQSRANLLPTIGMSANTQHTRSATKTNGPDVDDNYNSYGWGATLNQELFNMNKWYNYNLAKAQSSKAEADFANEQQQLILRVSEAYFNVLRAEDATTTAKAQEKAVQQQLDQARERFNVGLIAETDVLEAQAAYDNARVARIQSDNQVSVAYENLRTIVNHDITAISRLEKTMPVAAPMPANGEEWVQTAIKSNLSLQAAREGLNASEEGVRASKANHAPTVSAFASYNYSDSNSANAQRVINEDTGLMANGKGSQTAIGVRFDLPIFTGGATTSAVRQASYQMDQAQQTFDGQIRQVSSSTRNLFRTVNSDMERVQARCQGITSSESALRATQSGYEVGTRNITDVLDAQQKLYSAAGDYLNARYDFIVNTLQLKQAAGTLSPQDLTDLNEWMVAASNELAIPQECLAK